MGWKADMNRISASIEIGGCRYGKICPAINLSIRVCHPLGLKFVRSGYVYARDVFWGNYIGL